MALKEEFEHTGNWLFRWRSYLPILLLCIFVIGFFDLRLRAEDGGRGLMWELACFAVTLLGLAVRIYTAGYAPRGTSGRHTLRQEAKRLNSSGMYSLLRHPLYLGNALMWLGISLFVHVWWVVVISMLIFWIYYERIMFAEEEFLLQQFGHKFEVWAKKTPAFLPKFKNWIPPDKDFSWKKILRYESPTLLLITTSLAFLHALRDLIVLGTIEIDWVWITLLSITLLFYLVIRILRKTTRILS